MRGIERLVAGALLVLAVVSTAVLARTSAPGGARPALRLKSPPRSDVVAPLPVVVAVPAPPPRIAAAAPRAPVSLVQAAPAPPAPPTSTSAARVRAALQPSTATRTFGNSHPRGHAWGHLKHGHAYGHSKHTADD
jgi:hypothetical protein